MSSSKSPLAQCEEDLASQRKELGEGHVDLVPILGRLGLLHQHVSKDLDKATACHEEARRILEDNISDDDPYRETRLESLAATTIDLATLQEQKEMYDDSRRNFVEAQSLLVAVNCPQKVMLMASCRRGLDRISKVCPAVPPPQNCLQNACA